jgi:hypothetical protein
VDGCPDQCSAETACDDVGRPVSAGADPAVGHEDGDGQQGQAPSAVSRQNCGGERGRHRCVRRWEGRRRGVVCECLVGGKVPCRGPWSAHEARKGMRRCVRRQDRAGALPCREPQRTGLGRHDGRDCQPQATAAGCGARRRDRPGGTIRRELRAAVHRRRLAFGHPVHEMWWHEGSCHVGVGSPPKFPKRVSVEATAWPSPGRQRRAGVHGPFPEWEIRKPRRTTARETCRQVTYA